MSHRTTATRSPRADLARQGTYTARRQYPALGAPGGALALQRAAGNRASHGLMRPRGADTAPPAVRDILRQSGEPLATSAREMAEQSFGGNFSDVRVHRDAGAARSARALRARAYAVGRHIVFGAGEYAPASGAGRRLLAHELAHVVQQRGAPDGGGLRVLDAFHPAEVSAERAARQAMGREIVDPGPAQGLAVAREELDAVAVQSSADAVVDELSEPDPIAGVGDFAGAFRILARLPVQEMLAVLEELHGRAFLELLAANSSGRSSRVVAGIHVIRLIHSTGQTVSRSDFDQAGASLDALPGHERSEIVDYLTRARATNTAMATMTAEGLMAMAATTQLSVTATHAASVGPGTWAPPGSQPIPFYIGNEAHVAIAAVYVGAHPGDPVFTNFIPISTILTQTGINPTGTSLTAAQLAGRPDIANLAPTKHHLYEIKPTGAAGAAATEAAAYVTAFVAAGVPMTLGPSTEPGTTGVIPAPAGYFAFESTAPGVIVYQYRRGTFVPVPVRAPQTSTSRSFMDEMAAITGLTGTALVIYIIVSEGSRVAFPPRNLVPVP